MNAAVNRTNPTLREFLGLDEELLKETVDIPRKSTQKTKRDWSPKICEDFARAKKIPASLKSADSQRAIVDRFITFYATGKTSNTHSVKDIVLAMAHMIQTDWATNAEHLIWEDKYYGNDSLEFAFSIEGEAPITEDFDESFSQDSDPNLIAYLGGTEIKDPDKLTEMVKPFLSSYSPGSLKAFVKECHTVLLRSPAKKGLTKPALGVYKLFNFLSLVMIRKLTKTDQSFLKSNLKENVARLIGTKSANMYAPPCEDCIKLLTSAITKSDPDLSSFIAKCVGYWATNTTNPQVFAILRATFLTHTAWNGMGIIKMIFDVCCHLSISWKVLLRKTALTPTIVTWEEVVRFFTAHQRIDNEDKTVAWARVIDDAYFSYFSMTKHLHLACLLAETVMRIQGDRGLYSAQWAVRNQKLLEEYRPASEWLYQELSGVTGQEADFEEGIALAEKIMQYHPPRNPKGGQTFYNILDDLEQY